MDALLPFSEDNDQKHFPDGALEVSWVVLRYCLPHSPAVAIRCLTRCVLRVFLKPPGVKGVSVLLYGSVKRYAIGSRRAKVLNQTRTTDPLQSRLRYALWYSSLYTESVGDLQIPG